MTKLEAWKAWSATAGTDGTEFTLEKSSHGKAFSYAWDAAIAVEREACAKIADAERAAEFRRPVSAHKAGQYEMAEYIYEAIMARKSDDKT